jgi:hypothetical protein
MSHVRHFQIVTDDTPGDTRAFVAILARCDDGCPFVQMRDFVQFERGVERLVDLFQSHDEPEFACITEKALDDASIIAIMDATEVLPEGMLESKMPAGVLATIMRRPTCASPE